MTHKPKFSLKKKLIILIVSIIMTISLLAGLLSYKEIDGVIRDMYINRSRELSATAAAMLDPQMVKTVRDQVMDIFSATEDRVSTDDWGSPEFEAYLQKYDTVRDTSEYRTIQKQLRIVQDHNHLECVYLV